MSNTTYSFDEAKKAYSEGNYKEAFVILSELIVKDSRKTEYILWLGKIYLKNNQFFHAKKCCKEILSRASELNLKEEAKQLLTAIDINQAALNNISSGNSNDKTKNLTNQPLTSRNVQSQKKVQVITEKETQFSKHNSNSSILNKLSFIEKNKFRKALFKKAEFKDKNNVNCGQFRNCTYFYSWRNCISFSE